VGEDEQHHVSALGPIAAGTEAVGEVAFDHAEDGFALPSLAVLGLVKVGGHEPAVFRFGHLRCGPPDLCGNDGLDVAGFSCVLVVAFAVISCIGEQVFDRDVPQGSIQRLAELIDIDAGPPRGDHRKDQVRAAIADDSEFWKSLIHGLFQRLQQFRASSANEVAAGVARFQAGRIHSGQFDGFASAKHDGDCPLEHFPGIAGVEKPPRGLLQCREMRHGMEANRLAETRAVV